MKKTPSIDDEEEELPSGGDEVELGEETYRGFLLDCVYHAKDEGDIHFNVYIPESYTGSEPYVLYFTLPGYEGLYFQEVGVNLRAEGYAFEAQKYNDKMIIVAPQLSDWGMTSARQTVALSATFSRHTTSTKRKFMQTAIRAAEKRYRR